MVYAVAALAVICLTLLCVLVSFERANAHERGARAAAYERTLQTMADRIQAPARIPVSNTPAFEAPEREIDEYAQVGQITIDPDYGLTDTT